MLPCTSAPNVMMGENCTYRGDCNMLFRIGCCIVWVQQCCVAQVVRAIERGIQRSKIQDGHGVAVQAVGLLLDRVHQVRALAQRYCILQQ